MKFLKRASILAASLGAALAMIIVTPLAANAVTESPIDTDGFIQIEPGSTSAEAKVQILAALQELAGKQSAEQIQELSELPGTHYLVIDDSGEYASAVNIEPDQPAIAPFSIIGGQFCTVVNLCVYAGVGSYGFAGSGTAYVSLPPASSVYAGNLNAIVTSGGQTYYINAWGSVSFTGLLPTVTGFTRY